jgi:hypothetical protein
MASQTSPPKLKPRTLELRGAPLRTLELRGLCSALWRKCGAGNNIFYSTQCARVCGTKTLVHLVTRYALCTLSAVFAPQFAAGLEINILSTRARAGLRNQDTVSTWRLRTWRIIPEASGWRTQYGSAARVGLFDSGVGREGE